MSFPRAAFVALGTALAGFPMMATPRAAIAQAALVRSAVSGGAVDASNGTLRMRATVGEAGVVGSVSGPALKLGEGFWPGAYRWIATDAPPAAGEVQWANGLRQNFPNPFRGSTSIRYSVGREAPVRLLVYDVRGRRVATLVEGSRNAGIHHVDWDGRDGLGRRTASGVYFYRIHVGDWSDTHRMLKLR